MMSLFKLIYKKQMHQFHLLSATAKRFDQNSLGSTLVMVTVFIVALFAFAALSIDVGNVLTHRARIQEASDSAALAAVVTWAKDKDVILTQQVGKNFESEHGVQSNEVVSVTTGRWDDSTKTFIPAGALAATDVPAVEVIARRTVDLAFAPIIGMRQMSPRTRSIAVVGAATQAYGVVPWGVCGNSWISAPSCTTTTLQNDNNTCGGAGNFGALSLGGNGANVYENNIVNGYQGSLSIGQQLYTETGAMVGPTQQGVNTKLAGAQPYDCPNQYPNGEMPDPKRVIIVPLIEVVSYDSVNGKHLVKITKFLTFSLDSVSGGGKVDATYIETYNGMNVDPSSPPIPGGFNGTALVR